MGAPTGFRSRAMQKRTSPDSAGSASPNALQGDPLSGKSTPRVGSGRHLLSLDDDISPKRDMPSIGLPPISKKAAKPRQRPLMPSETRRRRVLQPKFQPDGDRLYVVNDAQHRRKSPRAREQPKAELAEVFDAQNWGWASAESKAVNEDNLEANEGQEHIQVS